MGHGLKATNESSFVSQTAGGFSTQPDQLGSKSAWGLTFLKRASALGGCHVDVVLDKSSSGACVWKPFDEKFSWLHLVISINMLI